MSPDLYLYLYSRKFLYIHDFDAVHVLDTQEYDERWKIHDWSQ